MVNLFQTSTFGRFLSHDKYLFLLYKIGLFRKINDKVESKYRPVVTAIRKQNRLAESEIILDIPKQYGDPKTISILRQYLINKRANNLTEAIEIYEVELLPQLKIAEEIDAMRRAEEITELNRINWLGK